MKFKSIEIKVSKTRAKKLIKGEAVLIKKIKGKNERVYSAEFRLEDTGKYVNLKLEKYFFGKRIKKILIIDKENKKL